MTVIIAGLLYVSRVAQHALGLHAAQICASRRGSEISDLAVDFRHFLNRPQHLLQTAFPAPIYLSGTSGLDLISINRIDCVWGVMAEESKIDIQ